MTRFEMEISGQLGEFWVSHAKKEVKRIVMQAATEATVDENGVIRWNSNGNCIPDDCCEMLGYAGFKFSREATKKAREIDEAEFIREYRSQKHELTEEELFEMRATFGAGTEVVNIISGERYKL